MLSSKLSVESRALFLLKDELFDEDNRLSRFFGEI